MVNALGARVSHKHGGFQIGPVEGPLGAAAYNSLFVQYSTEATVELYPVVCGRYVCTSDFQLESNCKHP